VNRPTTSERLQHAQRYLVHAHVMIQAAALDAGVGHDVSELLAAALKEISEARQKIRHGQDCLAARDDLQAIDPEDAA